MTDLLAGRGVVITGAGRGLGRAFALAAAREGAGVVVNDVDLDVAQAVAGEIQSEGGRALASGASVADWVAADQLIQECVEGFGSVDGLVNNAVAYTYFGPPWAEEEEQIRRAVDVAVLGTLFCGVHAMRRMREQKSGSIVNVSSRAHIGATGKSTYVAAKGAVTSLVYAWALELMGDNVRVNALVPGAHTRAHELALAAGTYRDSSRAIAVSPSVVAPAAVYLLSDLSARMTGQVFAMLGGRLGLMRHPRLREHMIERERWTPEKLAEVIESEFIRDLEPVGF